MATSVLSILIEARDGASAALARVSGSLNRVGVNAKLGHTAMSTLGMRMGQAARGAALLAGTSGLLGVGGVLESSITKARDFAAAMELLRTQTGATQAEVDSMSQAVLNLSGKVATAPEILAAGLYHIESAGLRGAKALEILQVAAEGARVGQADLESVTNALVGANQSGIKGVTDMAGAMGSLNAIVGSGNMRMQDLADAFSTGVLASAKTFGVSLQSVGAAIADMTDQSIPAVDAATRLTSAMRLMAAPSSKAQKLLKTIGIGATTLAEDMRGPGGILTAVQDLKSHLDKAGLSESQQAALLANAFGGRQSLGVLTLIGNIDLLKKKVAAVNKGATDFSGAWEATTHTAAFKFENFGAIADATLTKIGTKLLPMVADALGTLGNWFSEHADDISNFFASGARTAEQIAGIIGKVVGAFNALPGWLKQLLLTGAAINVSTKFLLGFSPLSLGKDIVSGILGGLGKSLFQRGGTPADPLFVANVAGGGGPPTPGVGGPSGPTKPSVTDSITKNLLRVITVATGAEIGAQVASQVNAPIIAPAKAFEQKQFQAVIDKPSIEQINAGIKSIEEQWRNPLVSLASLASYLPGFDTALGNLGPTLDEQYKTLQDLKAKLEASLQIQKDAPALAAARASDKLSSNFHQAFAQHAAVVRAGTAAVNLGAARTAAHLTVLENVDRGILAKKTSVSVHASIPVTVINNLSINEWQRKVVSQIRSNANYGGFI